MTLGKNKHTYSEAKSYLTNLLEYFERADEYVDKKNQFILRIPKGMQPCPSQQRG